MIRTRLRTPTVTALAAATMLLVGMRTAAADEPRALFGQAGQLSLGSDLNLASTNTLMSIEGGGGFGGLNGLLTPATMFDIGGSSTTNNGGSNFGFFLAPAADYFVVQNFSLGAEVLFGYATATPGSQPGSTISPQSTNVTTYGIAPRIGYNIPIGDSFSFWPKVLFEHAGYSIAGAGQGYGNMQLLGAYVPFLYHPVPHFYVGLGPNILTELGASTNGQGSSSKLTTYGVFASIGGYLSLGGG